MPYSLVYVQGFNSLAASKRVKSCHGSTTGFGDAGAMIRRSRHREQQIRKPIQVDDHDWLDGVLAERQHRALRAPAHGAGQMQRRACRSAVRQDEVPQHRDLGVKAIDPAFEARHAVVVDDDLLDALRDLVRRIGQPRAECEQIALQRHADARRGPLADRRRAPRRGTPAARRRRRTRRRADRSC